MWTCLVCHFGDIDLDDVAILLSRGRCVCVACFARAAGGRPSVSQTLQREINSETPLARIESDHETAAMERQR